MSIFSQALEPISCRGFFVIDALSEGALAWAKQALNQLGMLLSSSVHKPPPLGVAVLQRTAPGPSKQSNTTQPKHSTQLQIMLRPGSKFHLKEYLSCISRITAAHPGDAADGKTVGIAVKALVEHLLTIADGKGCSNHLFILSSNFTAHATLQRVLQLSGPENDCSDSTFVENAAKGSSTPHNLRQLLLQQQQLEFEQSLIGLADKATFNSFMADCEQVADLICHTWLRYLSTASNISLAGSSGQHSDVVLQLGALQLLCKLQQPLLQLESWLLPAQLCPCHQLPMQPPTGSIMSAAAASGAAGDAATSAGLLVLPERSQWHCSVTSQPVLPAPGAPAASADCSVMQLGRHTQLKMPAAAAAAMAREIRNPGMRPGLPSTLAMPVDQPCLLQVEHAVPAAQVDSMMVYGVPLILTPVSRSLTSAVSVAHSSSAAAGHALSTGGSSGTNSGCSTDSQNAGMLMKALCHLLLETEQLLLLSSHQDVVRRCQQPLKQWYIAQPAADGASLLLRYLACREQLLPPAGLALGCAEEEQMMMLDVQQLQAVQQALDSLPSLSNRRPGSSGGDRALDGIEAALPAPNTGATVRGCQGGAGNSLPLPMLLSCGLFDWLHQVLDQCTGTYIIPATAPQVIQQAPPQHLQQQPAAFHRDKDVPVQGMNPSAADIAASAFAQRPTIQQRAPDRPGTLGPAGGLGHSKHGFVAAQAACGLTVDAGTGLKGKVCNEQIQQVDGNRAAGQSVSQRLTGPEPMLAGVVNSDAGRGRGGSSSRRSALRLSSRSSNGKHQTK